MCCDLVYVIFSLLVLYYQNNLTLVCRFGKRVIYRYCRPLTDMIRCAPMRKNSLPIRHISQIDQANVLALNQDHIEETSSLDMEALQQLIDVAFHTGVSGDGDGFCIAMDQASDHKSQHFQWFAARQKHFVYVDRIIVAGSARGLGVARALYTELIETAREAQHEMLCCEVNINPPNPGSEAFHTRLGFEKIDEAVINESGKKVGYWVLGL